VLYKITNFNFKIIFKIFTNNQRGLVDKNGDQFVAYFLPSDETVKKIHRDTENEVDYDADDEYDFKLAREYTWNIKSKISQGYEENYYFIIKDDGVYYNELETRYSIFFRININKK